MPLCSKGTKIPLSKGRKMNRRKKQKTVVIQDVEVNIFNAVHKVDEIKFNIALDGSRSISLDEYNRLEQQVHNKIMANRKRSFNT